MHAKLVMLAFLLAGAYAADTVEDHVRKTFNLPKVEKPQSREKSCGLDKKCVQAYFCSNGNTNTDGATIINVRFNDEDESECAFAETCCDYENIVTKPIITSLETGVGCGFRNTDGVGFKLDDATNEAEFGEFPWMLAIIRGRADYDEDRFIFHCGASLIHPQVALTGAHCVYGKPPEAFKVRAGEWDTNSKNEVLPDQDRLVVDFVIHENYNNTNLHNDIALLFLESPFEMAPNVNTLCLPPAGYNFDFSRCYATGWGRDEYPNGRYHNILKKVDLPTVPSYVCQENLRKTRLSKHFLLDWSFMCAGGEPGKDTCQGDGGSPLACPIDNVENRYYQAGIVSWGIGCGEEDVPGVYTNVAQFRPWIDEQFAFKKIDSSYYTSA